MIVESHIDLLHWSAAMEPYTVQQQSVKRVYQFNSKIGEGSYGHVYKATAIKHKNEDKKEEDLKEPNSCDTLAQQQIVAIKKIDKQ